MTDAPDKPFKPGDSFHEMDPLIAPIVLVLREYGIDTVQSCQGGEGHSYSRPTVEFRGHSDQGYKAVHIAMQNGLPHEVLASEMGHVPRGIGRSHLGNDVYTITS